MEEISKAHITISKALGEQCITHGDNVSLASWCVATTADCGILLLNNLTKELILIDKGESEFLCVSDLQESDIDSIRDSELFDYLVKNWFLVSTEHDDLKLINEVRDVVTCFDTKEGINSYTILTTTDCNARCFYCYEKGIERVSMSKQTALDVAEYIKKNAGKKVGLHWFGGEPLFNISVIDIITSELRKAGIEFESSMISNGYLATDNVVKKAVENWNLKKVQITLDGTEEVYNERKAYVNPEGSAFQRVLDNIERLLKAGIRVSIRLNLDLDNAEDLYKLSELLADRFSSYEKLGVYSHYLYGEKYSESFDRTCSENSKLNAYLTKKGLSHCGKIDKRIKTNHCMADNDSAVVVTPTGELHKCEHVGITDKCGTIYGGITNQDVIDYWKKRPEIGEICRRCPMYADCVKLVACPDDFDYCPQVVYDDKLQKLKDSMLYTYEMEMKK
ncbi:MAG: radical SAM protein [Oscillospiraceae bacterium]|nr:radical SAM protein [Oscillospiraceae bacterium]